LPYYIDWSKRHYIQKTRDIIYYSLPLKIIKESARKDNIVTSNDKEYGNKMYKLG
jgi:hypothetical protein